MLHAPCPIPEARCLVRTNARRQRQQQATRSNALILVTTLPLRFCGWPHLLGKSVAAKALATTNCCSWPSGAINICDSEMQLRGNNEYSRSDCLLFPLFPCHSRAFSGLAPHPAIDNDDVYLVFCLLCRQNGEFLGGRVWAGNEDIWLWHFSTTFCCIVGRFLALSLSQGAIHWLRFGEFMCSSWRVQFWPL